jgi:hypothetical protein
MYGFDILSIYRDFFDEIDYEYKNIPIDIEVELGSIKDVNCFPSYHRATIDILNALYYNELSNEFSIKCIMAKLTDNNSNRTPIQGICFDEKSWVMGFLSKYGKLIAESNLRKNYLWDFWNKYIYLENSIYGNTVKRHVADIIQIYGAIKFMMQHEKINKLENGG